jgi:hypothetical protein
VAREGDEREEEIRRRPSVAARKLPATPWLMRKRGRSWKRWWWRWRRSRARSWGRRGPRLLPTTCADGMVVAAGIAAASIPFLPIRHGGGIDPLFCSRRGAAGSRLRPA